MTTTDPNDEPTGAMWLQHAATAQTVVAHASAPTRTWTDGSSGGTPLSAARLNALEADLAAAADVAAAASSAASTASSSAGTASSKADAATVAVAGLGNAARRNVGTVANTVAAGDDPRFYNRLTIFQTSDGSWALRSTVTADPNARVNWEAYSAALSLSNPPPIGSGYASGIDLFWFKT